MVYKAKINFSILVLGVLGGGTTMADTDVVKRQEASTPNTVSQAASVPALKTLTVPELVERTRPLAALLNKADAVEPDKTPTEEDCNFIRSTAKNLPDMVTDFKESVHATVRGGYDADRGLTLRLKAEGRMEGALRNLQKPLQACQTSFPDPLNK